MQTSERYELRLFKVDGNQEQEIERREVPREKLEQQIAKLPNREAMSLVNANLAAPINIALAANVLSDNSVAIAEAEQYAPIQQNI